ncbi:MAG: DUF2238 domain-containing protein [Anaerolineae bacterium]|nr:DUF2238 domain-containing protein [Anaerolineae bacterium]
MSKHAATVSSREGLVLLGAVSLALIASAVSPFDRVTWVMEVVPALVVAPVLILTRKRFPLTRLLYWLIALHALILIYGGAYTYARVPLGFWMEDLFGFTRNHYDRIGHFAQGFIPAIAAREILLRTSPLRRGKWLFFLVSATCLAISAVYEFIEWWAALISAQAAEAFLGTQGDPWDTQWDMFLATLGAITAQILLARLHDRQLATLSA